MQVKLSTKFGITIDEVEENLGKEMVKSILKQSFLKSNESSNKIGYLETNIDNMLNDLSEIFPIFAYELSGQHNIKERLNKLDIVDSSQELINQIPFDLKSFIEPKMTKNLLNDIDESIERIASKIDKKTKKEALEKISNMSFENGNIEEMDNIIDEYLAKIESSL